MLNTNTFSITLSLVYSQGIRVLLNSFINLYYLVWRDSNLIWGILQMSRFLQPIHAMVTISTYRNIYRQCSLLYVYSDSRPLL